MKSNSLRLRLTRSEIERLKQEGAVRETVEFGNAERARFTFALEVRENVGKICAELNPQNIVVFLPSKIVREWTSTDLVGIEATQEINEKKTLKIVIEKDFACAVRREGEDDPDAFPHPTKRAIC